MLINKNMYFTITQGGKELPKSKYITVFEGPKFIKFEFLIFTDKLNFDNKIKKLVFYRRILTIIKLSIVIPIMFWIQNNLPNL